MLRCNLSLIILFFVFLYEIINLWNTIQYHQRTTLISERERSSKWSKFILENALTILNKSSGNYRNSSKLIVNKENEKIQMNTRTKPLMKTTLLNLTDFYYIKHNENLCKVQNDDNLILILISIARNRAERRSIIRKTFGSLKRYSNYNFRLGFLLGLDSIDPSNLSSGISRNDYVSNDLIIGNFIDTYWNLTYKHMMGLEWMAQFCPEAQYLVKIDDDTTPNLFEIVHFIQSELNNGEEFEENIFCRVNAQNHPLRSNSKWALTYEEYPSSYFPEYCLGFGYIITKEGVARTIEHADEARFLWIDDVFVTGLVREKAELKIWKINDYYIEALNYDSCWGTRDPHLEDWFFRIVSVFETTEKEVEKELFFMWTKMLSAQLFLDPFTTNKYEIKF